MKVAFGGTYTLAEVVEVIDNLPKYKLDKKETNIYLKLRSVGNDRVFKISLISN